MGRSGTRIVLAYYPSSLATNRHASISHDVHKDRTAWSVANSNHVGEENKVTTVICLLLYFFPVSHSAYREAGSGKLQKLAAQ